MLKEFYFKICFILLTNYYYWFLNFLMMSLLIVSALRFYCNFNICNIIHTYLGILKINFIGWNLFINRGADFLIVVFRISLFMLISPFDLFIGLVSNGRSQTSNFDNKYYYLWYRNLSRTLRMSVITVALLSNLNHDERMTSTSGVFKISSRKQ